MNALIFCLGAVSAVVVILIIAMVVVVLKLRSLTESLKTDVHNLYQLRDSDLKDHDVQKKEHESENQQNFDSIYRDLSTAQDSCNKYTDSRIDKLTEKLSK